ncbi:MAG: Retaining alpha-galactosidase [Cytophagales bacterium]|nr:Retaining alpha-galactosidase [Cytophagales bacterium]
MLVLVARAESFLLRSPDQKVETEIVVSDRIYYNLLFDGVELMWLSPISMTLANGKALGVNPKLVKKTETQVDESISTVWGVRSTVRNHYRQLRLDFEGAYSLVFRAYDDGVAYRFITAIKKEIVVKEEQVEYRFLENFAATTHDVGDFQSSYEKFYTRQRILDMKEDQFASLPLLVHAKEAHLALLEADLFDYPGLYIQKPGMNSRTYLKGIFPHYPTRMEEGGWSQFNLRVTERADYVAKTNGNREFPWRAILVASDDRELLDSDLVYKLSRPSQIPTAWIKPGKVAWDWWNDWNLEQMPFETGVNNRTYEYYIDFAAKNKLEYIILDEGWSDQFNLFLPKPDVDVPYLVDYADKKGVKLILWCVWHTLDRQMQDALDMFQAWGVAGVKVDFIDRDDQLAIRFYERLAAEAAKRQLLVDYHGCSKPTGLHRTYPNVINYEAVRGNEYNKFSQEGISPQHGVDLLFTRQLAGPMDYTPGAMRNATQGNWAPNNSLPMSLGTRARELAMYVCYYAPLQMLCDALPNTKIPDHSPFPSAVPTTWG